MALLSASLSFLADYFKFVQRTDPKFQPASVASKLRPVSDFISSPKILKLINDFVTGKALFYRIEGLFNSFD